MTFAQHSPEEGRGKRPPPMSSTKPNVRIDMFLENSQRCQRCGFLVLGPRRAERTSEDGDLVLHPTCRLAELFSQAFIEIALSNSGDSKIKTFAGFANGA